MDFIDGLENGIPGVFFLGSGENIENYAKTHGILRKNKDNLVEIIAVNEKEDDFSLPELDNISIVSGRTQQGEVLIPQINHIKLFDTYSAKEFYTNIMAREFIYGHNACSFMDGKIEKLEIIFAEASSWTGNLFQDINQSEDKNEMTVKVSSRNLGNKDFLDGTFNLEIEKIFKGTSNHSNVSFNTPLKFTIRSLSGAVHIDNYVPLITQLQDLLNFSQHAFIPIDTIEIFHGSKKASLWSESFMKTPSGATEYDSKSLPFFTLTTIGGIDGVVKWLNGYNALSRVIGPISSRWPTKHMTLETRILNAGSATESLFAAEARRRRALRDKTSLDFNQLFVVKRAGESFKNWLSESEDLTRKFAELLNINFNLIKHNDFFDQDYYDSYGIAESTEIMLEGIVFDIIYPDLDLSNVIYNKRKTYQAQERIREILKKDIKRSSY